ncbi:molybdopterin-dependent oxidoreductase [Adlercreutzia sp. R25]|uniref:Molybdopterin-dependent oxidoreductase n=1 Tax=Adlercreutzia shanghongiae TaxID=3111773 RepID=A0ABU6IX69_9ACTN|nr:MULTISPECIES: molybdopterin-dependent oxidoreductase [unclassified Adlercreutzia]MEC4272661.1 molybdopterin-dependent oxidoreductase [Adlercreutzia sp. R25]MEC4294438.1 molybdopterin-dependent oxidoreductase [Adlercreutzia sp. R22]
MRDCFNPEVYKKDWQYQEGDLTVTRSTQWSAPGCHQGCSILFYTDKDGKLVKVEGDPNSPVTDGRLCMRCLAMVEAVYHPDRILHPMKRDRDDRGKDKWVQITMDEAYELCAEMVKDTTEKYGAKSICTGAGTGRNATWQSNVLGQGAFGTPNDNCGMLAGNCCYTPRMQGMNAVLGDTFIADCGQLNEARFDHPEYRRPDLILIWGNNPLRANADGFYGHWIIDCMRRGSKLFVVDPQVTWLAAHAEQYIQVRPGTDAALALAIGHVMIEEELYDKEFIDLWCYGFDEYKERVADWTPERAAEICWCDPEDIYAAARLIGTAGVTTLQWGVAFDQNKEANGTAHSVVLLQAMTGNIDNPGGFVGINFGYVQSDIRENVAKGLPKVREGRLGDDGNWGLMNAKGKGGHAIPEAILDACETGEPYPVKMLFMCSTTAFTNMAGQARRIYNAFKEMDHVVICDLFMTPTAMAIGDLFIPMAMGCERNGVRGWYTPLRAITKVTQTGEAIGDEQMMLELGKKMNPDLFYWDDVPEMLEFCTNNMATVPIQITFSELREKVIVYPEFTYYKYKTGKLRFDGQPGFNTLSGRIEFFCNMYNNVGMDPLPYFKEPPESPVSTPELFAEFPLVMTTGRRCWEYFHSEHRQLHTMREFHKWPMFAIHPDDAEAAGIKEGDWAVIENSHGKAIEVAHVTDTMLKGVISAEHGWWFPERPAEEPSLFGLWESNINCCTVQGDFGPSGYGSSYKTQLAKVYPAPEGYGAEFEKLYEAHNAR